MSWFLKAMKQYADFKGRAQRAEYWYFTLFYLILYCGAMAMDHALGTTSRHKDGMGLLTFLFFLAMSVPGFAVGVRRMHDTGRSGWWIWISLVPLIGAFIYVYFAAQDSSPGDNAYGPNPKGL